MISVASWQNPIGNIFPMANTYLGISQYVVSDYGIQNAPDDNTLLSDGLELFGAFQLFLTQY